MTEEKLKRLRKEIDELDDQLFGLLVKRIKVVQKIARVKAEDQREICDRSREREILDRIQKHAKKNQLSGDFSEIFRAIFRYSKGLQEEL